MTREDALALAALIAFEHGTVTRYARWLGIPLGTLMSRAHRAGVKLGLEVRAQRLTRCEALRANGLTCERASLDAGFSSPSAMHRARKSVRRWRELERAA